MKTRAILPVRAGNLFQSDKYRSARRLLSVLSNRKKVSQALCPPSDIILTDFIENPASETL